MSVFFIDVIFAAIAGFGFSYANKPPKRILFFCALLGGFGYAIRLVLLGFLNYTLATFISALFVGFFAVFVAKKVRTPIEVLAFPSLLPMIPGLFAYKAMLAIFRFIEADGAEEKSHYLVEIFNNGITAISAVFALAVGISVVILFFYEESFTMTRDKKFREKYL
ncbi:MAG: threonine/serine exporter [Campylobacteraceae bacterium]|nr:threonine/serine exporter [Campylobacteraceae bacterium]